jgi:hypothetical protein
MDDEMATRRAAVLRDLVELRIPPTEAAHSLRSFGWDSCRELVTLGRLDARRVLDQYSRGDLNAEDCARWADALEGREDLAFEAGFEDLLTNFLFEVANPEINGSLSVQFVERWRAALDDRPESAVTE